MDILIDINSVEGCNVLFYDIDTFSMWTTGHSFGFTELNK